MAANKYVMSRADYARIADEIMHYVTKELGADKITMLPFVTNITEEIRPIIEDIVNKEKDNEITGTTE